MLDMMSVQMFLVLENVGNTACTAQECLLIQLAQPLQGTQV
jgi:hypothetical protein